MTGNLSIDKEDPAILLTDSSSSRTLSVFNDNNNSVVRASGPLLLQVGSQSAITIDTSRHTTLAGNLDVTGTITGDDGLSIQGGAGNAYLQVGSNTGSWTWKNYQSTHKLALEDSDGTGEVLNFDTSGTATFAGIVNSTALTVTGNSFIGNSSSHDADARLHVAASDTSPNLGSTTPETYTALFSNSDGAYGTMFGTLGTGVGVIQQRRTNDATVYDLSLQGYGGNVGIGTTNPDGFKTKITSAAKGLFVEAGDNGYTALGFDGDGLATKGSITSHNGKLLIGSENSSGTGSNGELKVIPGTGNVMTLDGSTAYVGIGTESPIEKLDVNSYSGISVNNNYAHMGSTVSGGMAIFGHNIKSDSANNTIKSANTGYHSSMIKMYYNEGITFHSTSGTNTAGDTFYNISGTTNEHMRITNDGKVGIGTTSPNYKLEVLGPAGFRNGSFHIGTENGSNTGAVEFYVPVADPNTLRIYRNVGAFGGTYSAQYAALDLYSGGAYSTRISGSGNSFFNSGGNVGIGTDTPGTKLDVLGKFNVQSGQVWSETTQGGVPGSIHIDPNSATDHTGGSITFGASDTGSGTSAQAGIYVRSDGSYGTKMYLSTTDSYAAGSKTAMMIDNTGLVGIGTIAPNAPLTVWTDSTSTSQSALRLNNPGGFASSGAGCEIIFSQDRSTSEDYRMAAISSSQQYTGSSAGGELKFWTRNSGSITEKVRLHANGVLAASAGIALGSGLANTAANTLDDYEEGTFTPVVEDGTYTYAQRRGHYTKIGNIVHIHIGLRLASASPGSGVGTISGLPFTSITYGSYQEPHGRIGAGGVFVTANLGSHLTFYKGNSNTLLYARTTSTNADSPVYSNGIWQAGTFIKLQMSYTVS
jgi:hypothetical protein